MPLSPNWLSSCSNLLGREGFILREHRCPSVGGRVSFVVLRGEAKAGLKTAFCVRRLFVLSSLSFSLLTFKATVIDSSVFEDTVYEGSVVGRWLVACDLTESLCTQSPLSTVVNHHALTIGFLTIGFLKSVFLQSTFQLSLSNHRFLMTAICTTALLTDACLIDCSRCSIVPGTFSALAYHRST